MCLHIRRAANDDHESEIHDIMTLFLAGDGQMAIRHECEAIHDIMTLFTAGDGRMTIYRKLRSDL